MKKIITLLAFIIVVQQKVQSQTPTWSWIRTSELTSLASADDICTDNFGNIYATGSYRDLLVFAGDTLYAGGVSGDYDIYLAKYDSAGNEIWARHAGGNYDDHGYSVATDKDGNVYIVGECTDTARFDTAVVTGLSRDLCLAKYDSSGNLQWVKTTTQSTAFGYGIGIDSLNNCYITGTYAGNFQFDNITLPTRNNYDIFICKIDESGNIIWAKSAGGNNYDVSYAIDVDPVGNCLITGYFVDTSLFGNTWMMSVGSSDGFVAKYDSGGNFQWVNRFGGSRIDMGNDIVSDASGNIFITGSFKDTASFILNNIISNGEADVLVAKMDANGNLIWARHGGGSQDDTGNGIAVDQNGNVMVTGTFKGNAIFSGDSMSAGFRGNCFLNYDAYGNLNWTKQAGSLLSTTDGLSLCKSSTDDFYFGGTTTNDVYFDSIHVVLSYYNSFYVARLDHFNIIAGVESPSEKFDFEIYPNPVSENLMISIPDQARNKNNLFPDLNIIVTDMTGRKYFSGKMSDTREINMSQLKKGMYLISIFGEGESWRRRVVKL